MKIAFLIKYFYPYKWWAENNCYFLAKELSKKHEVHIFCSGVENSEEILDWIFVHRCKVLFELSYYLCFYPSLLKKICSHQFDIIHAHGIWFPQHDVIIKFLKNKFPKTKFVCTPHGPFMPTWRNILGKLFKAFYMPFVKYFLRDYNMIIQVNPYQHEWLEKDYSVSHDIIEFIPNGIPDKFLIDIQSKKNLETIKGYDLEDFFIISYLGRVQKYKWLDQVIKSLPSLLKLKKNILFIVMGKDSWDKQRLENLSALLWVKWNVIFTGEVSEYDKFNILNLSEIFVFPSEWEAFGIALLEAMANRNSIISTKTEGWKYLISEWENGYLYDFWDVDSLIFLLKKLLLDTKIRNAIKNNNSEKVKTYLWSKIAIQIEHKFTQLLNNR